MASTEPVGNNLLDEYRKLAAKGENFHGLSILQYKVLLGRLVHETGSTSLLDYGCGRGDAWHSPHQLHHYLGIRRKNLCLYDPSFPKHDKLPTGKYDGVLCSDVLEHVPGELVGGVIATLFGYANKFVWASICCRPAKKSFADGTNMHVTVKPMEWWESQFVAIGRAVSIQVTGEEDSYFFRLTETK